MCSPARRWRCLWLRRSAAPFAPLPAEMAKKFDVAHLEFTMNITHDEGFAKDAGDVRVVLDRGRIRAEELAVPAP